MSASPVYASKSGVRPAFFIAALGAAFALSGCASTSENYAEGTRVYSEQVADASRVEIEDDGLPAQAAPLRNRETPDDPSEPYSRNYGGPNPAAATAPPKPETIPQRPEPAKIPKDLPPAFRRQLAAALAAEVSE